MPVVHKRINRPAKASSGWYSEDQKLAAFALYMSLGNMAEVGEQLKINIKTLYKWKYSPWWKEQIRELEQGNKIKLGTKVSKLLSKSTLQLEDRLDNGNLVWNPTKRELERRPLTSKEIVEIFRSSVQAQEMVDRTNELLDGKDLKEQRAAEQMAKLNAIAQKLGVRESTPQVIDVQPIVKEITNGILEESIQEGA